MSCPGPTKGEKLEDGTRIWYCDGKACDQKGIPDTCKKAILDRGYAFAYSEKAIVADPETIRGYEVK